MIKRFFLSQARSKLRHHSAAVQVPIGLEEEFQGLVDLVQLKAYYFHGSSGSVSESRGFPRLSVCATFVCFVD